MEPKHLGETVGTTSVCSQGKAYGGWFLSKGLPPMKVVGQVMSSPLGPVWRKSGQSLLGTDEGSLEILTEMGHLRFSEGRDEPEATEGQEPSGSRASRLVSRPPAPCHTLALGSDSLSAGSLTTYGLPRGVPLYLTPTL